MSLVIPLWRPAPPVKRRKFDFIGWQESKVVRSPEERAWQLYRLLERRGDRRNKKKALELWKKFYGRLPADKREATGAW